jgi:hypothetical protein
MPLNSSLACSSSSIGDNLVLGFFVRLVRKRTEFILYIKDNEFKIGRDGAGI